MDEIGHMMNLRQQLDSLESDYLVRTENYQKVYIQKKGVCDVIIWTISKRKREKSILILQIMESMRLERKFFEVQDKQVSVLGKFHVARYHYIDWEGAFDERRIKEALTGYDVFEGEENLHNAMHEIYNLVNLSWKIDELKQKYHYLLLKYYKEEVKAWKVGVHHFEIWTMFKAGHEKTSLISKVIRDLGLVPEAIVSCDEQVPGLGELQIKRYCLFHGEGTLEARDVQEALEKSRAK